MTQTENYRWIEDWVTIPESPLAKERGRTHGVAVSRTGNILIFHQADPALLIYDTAGKLLERWGNYPGAHSMTLVEEDGVESLWLTDQVARSVTKTTLTGEVLQELGIPEHPLYADQAYIPTWVAVNETRFGGNGDIWVADGYGASLLHRFDRQGRLIQTLDGESGAGRFRCPHGIHLDRRGDSPELYVTDRANQRVQVYDLNGRFVRSFGEGFLTSPCAFATFGDRLILPELKARLTVLDAEDRLLKLIGRHDEVCEGEKWPNNRELVKAGNFNSPHDAAADEAGNLYVVEWITGGRVTKLERLE